MANNRPKQFQQHFIQWPNVLRTLSKIDSFNVLFINFFHLFFFPLLLLLVQMESLSVHEKWINDNWQVSGKLDLWLMICRMKRVQFQTAFCFLYKSANTNLIVRSLE